MTHTTANSGTVEHIDPSTLVIEANVRPSAPLTPAFVDSIRENGVLTPVLARRDDKGNVLVRAGQRRTLASREAGLSTIPVYIVSADEATAERIIQQMVENDQREALTDGDRAAAFQQLAFEGLTVAAIAKRTGTKAAEVKTAIAVAENPAAASAIHEYAITLDQVDALDGRAAFVRLDYSGDPVIRYYLRDPEAAGFTNTDRNTGANSGPMSDEQKEERRTLIANNKAWDSAETVRRAWLTTLLSRKTLPKDTAAVIAAGLTIHRHAISRFTGE